MKNEIEIKKFIDKRKALTKKELIQYIYDIYGGANYRSKIFLKWWNYVLKTKNWKDLRELFEQREKLDKFKKFKEIIKKDKRVLELGCDRGIRFLYKHYNFKISVPTFTKYKALCTNSQNKL